MAGVQQIVADLRAESDELDALVAPLAADGWAASTPAAGWTIAHQIGHLLWTDRVALTAVTDEPAFAALLEIAATDPTGFVDAGADELAATAPAELLADWRATRAAARRAVDGSRRPQAAVVRTADECCVDGDGTADGDLGTRTRRRRHHRRHSSAD